MLSILILFLLLILLLPIVYSGYLMAPPVPSPQTVVESMLKLADVKSGDKVYDLGAGDGRIIIAAAKKFGAKSVGFELSPLHYLWIRIRIKRNNLGSKVKIIYGNFYKADLRGASVITIFGHPTTMKRIQIKIINKIKQKTRVVSYAFPINNMKPQQVLKLKNYAPIYLYEIN